MSAPRWEDAPTWAQYLGVDATGGCYWHEVEPKLYVTEWYSKEGRTSYAGRRRFGSARLERRP